MQNINGKKKETKRRRRDGGLTLADSR